MRRLFLVFIVIGVLFCWGSGEPQSVLAATVFDSESDDTTATANEMQLGDTISGTITETDNLDYYKFQLGSAVI